MIDWIELILLNEKNELMNTTDTDTENGAEKEGRKCNEFVCVFILTGFNSVTSHPRYSATVIIWLMIQSISWFQNIFIQLLIVMWSRGRKRGEANTIKKCVLWFGMDRYPVPLFPENINHPFLLLFIIIFLLFFSFASFDDDNEREIYGERKTSGATFWRKRISRGVLLFK